MKEKAMAIIRSAVKFTDLYYYIFFQPTFLMFSHKREILSSPLWEICSKFHVKETLSSYLLLESRRGIIPP